MGIFGDILGGLGDILSGPIGQTGAQLAGQYLQARYQPQPIVNVYGGPPGAGFAPQPAPIATPVFSGRTGVQFPLLPSGTQIQTASVLNVPQPRAWAPDPSCPSFFEPTNGSPRPVALLQAANPVTGKMAYWEHAGRPVLFSRDLRVCKRVGKIAARAARSRPRRRGKR